MTQKHGSRLLFREAAPAEDHGFGDQIINDRATLPTTLRDWQARRIAGRFFLSLPTATVIAELHHLSTGRAA